MKIYTSYIANQKKIVEAGIRPISIARFNRWNKLPKILDLAPTAKMLKLPDEAFRAQYADQLASLDPRAILAGINTLADGQDVALCCFEKPDKFCHRQMVAEWFKKNGIGVEELEL